MERREVQVMCYASSAVMADEDDGSSGLVCGERKGCEEFV